MPWLASCGEEAHMPYMPLEKAVKRAIPTFPTTQHFCAGQIQSWPCQTNVDLSGKSQHSLCQESPSAALTLWRRAAELGHGRQWPHGLPESAKTQSGRFSESFPKAETAERPAWETEIGSATPKLVSWDPFKVAGPLRERSHAGCAWPRAAGGLQSLFKCFWKLSAASACLPARTFGKASGCFGLALNPTTQMLRPDPSLQPSWRVDCVTCQLRCAPQVSFGPSVATGRRQRWRQSLMLANYCEHVCGKGGRGANHAVSHWQYHW